MGGLFFYGMVTVVGATPWRVGASKGVPTPTCGGSHAKGARSHGTYRNVARRSQRRGAGAGCPALGGEAAPERHRIAPLPRGEARPGWPHLLSRGPEAEQGNLLTEAATYLVS